MNEFSFLAVSKKGEIIMPDSSFHFGRLVSEFAHAAINGPPIQPQGQDVSSFVHELDRGFGSFSIDALGWVL
jgi:hypothetical protein